MTLTILVLKYCQHKVISQGRGDFLAKKVVLFSVQEKRHEKRPAGLKRDLLCDLKKIKISARKVDIRMATPGGM